MDKAAQLAMTWNLEAFKEPRGFIKIIEVVIAIFAFATTTSVYTSSRFEVKYANCSNLDKNITFYYGYPFDLSTGEAVFKFQDSCDAEVRDVHPYGNFSPGAQFYVFVGVMAFLYSVAAIILYVCFDEVYRRNDKIPMADFIISAVFVLLWLISAAAWADGVSKVKTYTYPYDMFFNEDRLGVCNPNTDNGITCKTIHQGNFASLNVSIIFGFLNMCVWGGNLWFLFKETAWHKVTTEHPETSPSETPQKV